MKGFALTALLAVSFFVSVNCNAQSLWDLEQKPEPAKKVQVKKKKEEPPHPSRVFSFQELHPEIAKAGTSLQLVEQELNWFRFKRFEAEDGLAAANENGKAILLYCYNGSPCGRT